MNVDTPGLVQSVFIDVDFVKNTTESIQGNNTVQIPFPSPVIIITNLIEQSPS
jgi:hypothetical protein